MLMLVGLVVVLGAVVGGFLMAGGELMVLIQPSEFVVIGGAALGSLIVSTPMKVMKLGLAQIKAVMSGATQLMRMPRPAHSSDKVRASDITPALAMP